MWSAYRDDDPSRPVDDLDENATPGLAPAGKAGVDPVELVVDGETFVVTRRADSPRTFDFDWTSHPESYGFTVGMNFDWDCVPASGVTPLRVMLCVVHYAVRAWVVSITSGWAGRVGRAVGSGGVSRAMEVSER